jgi:hypothetical protein
MLKKNVAADFEDKASHQPGIKNTDGIKKSE